MTDSDLQGNDASVAPAEKVGLLDLERSEKRRGVVHHLLEGQRAIDVGSVPVSLLLDGDDLPGLGKEKQSHSERRVDCRQAVVKQDQRP
jgi:hypothetical protein